MGVQPTTVDISFIIDGIPVAPGYVAKPPEFLWEPALEPPAARGWGAAISASGLKIAGGQQHHGVTVSSLVLYKEALPSAIAQGLTGIFKRWHAIEEIAHQIEAEELERWDEEHPPLTEEELAAAAEAEAAAAKEKKKKGPAPALEAA